MGGEGEEEEEGRRRAGGGGGWGEEGGEEGSRWRRIRVKYGGESCGVCRRRVSLCYTPLDATVLRCLLKKVVGKSRGRSENCPSPL